LLRVWTGHVTVNENEGEIEITALNTSQLEGRTEPGHYGCRRVERALTHRCSRATRTEKEAPEVWQVAIALITCLAATADLQNGDIWEAARSQSEGFDTPSFRTRSEAVGA